MTEAENHVRRLGDVVEEAHADLRELILNLRLAPSEQRPLFATIRHYLDGFSQNYGIGTELSVEPGVDEARLDAGAKMQLFRIIQEAFSNARKHARASRVCLSFEARDGRVRVRIQDNGCGFDPASAVTDAARHLGMGIMQARAEEIGGTLRVESVQGAGTSVVVELPLHASQREEPS